MLYIMSVQYRTQRKTVAWISLPCHIWLLPQWRSTCLDRHFSFIHTEVMVLDWGQSPEPTVCFERIHRLHRCSRATIVCRVNSSLMMSFSVTWREIDPCCVSIPKMPPAQLWLDCPLAVCGTSFLRDSRSSSHTHTDTHVSTRRTLPACWHILPHHGNMFIECH